MSRKSKQIGSDSDLAAWCAALASPIIPDKVPPGWRTSAEICALLGKSPTRTSELLRCAVREGRAEKKQFRIAAAGTVRPVPHYRLK